MRIGLDDKFWVVVDATPKSFREDILFECSLRGLYRQIAGGLTIEQNPTLYTDYKEAEHDANQRLYGRDEDLQSG